MVQHFFQVASKLLKPCAQTLCHFMQILKHFPRISNIDEDPAKHAVVMQHATYQIVSLKAGKVIKCESWWHTQNGCTWSAYHWYCGQESRESAGTTDLVATLPFPHCWGIHTHTSSLCHSRPVTQSHQQIYLSHHSLLLHITFFKDVYGKKKSGMSTDKVGKYMKTKLITLWKLMLPISNLDCHN